MNAADTHAPIEEARYPGRRAVWGWIMYDWAAQPYFTLITTFIFAPYFVAHLAPTPVIGQSYWGYVTGFAGLVIAVLSPILGSIADTTGPRKPWIAMFSVMLFAGCAALWFAAPGVPSAITIALVAYAIATIGAEFGIVFTNAMMPSLAPPHKLGRLSGNGWAAGYVGGLICLAITLGFLAGSPETGLTMLGSQPIFGLDPALFEGERASGPFSAIWYLIFVIPLFLFTPDTRRNTKFDNMAMAAKAGLAVLRATLNEIGSYGQLVRFLIARMIYADGLVALFAFGGIYGASVFEWTSIELGIFGILLTITGSFGALAGGYLDDRVGSKWVIMLSLILLIGSTIGVLSIRTDSWLFMIDAIPRVSGDAPFSSTTELVFLALGAVIGSAAGPLQAASRTMLISLSPPEKMTQIFGLYALSGKVTSFVGPISVGLLTAISNSQRIGISVLLVFFIVGFFLLIPLKTSKS